MSLNVGVISLGCPKNLVDSEIMLGLLEKDGYHITSDPSKADIIIVNTCGFIEDAKRESIEAILEMAKFKERGRAKHLVVTGCLPQRYREDIYRLFPEVDLLIGTGEYHRIVQLIEKLDKKKPGARDVSKGCISVPEYIHTCKTPRKIATPPHAVYVKIAEGCFHGCSFCAIPSMRGRYRSRGQADIVREVKELLKAGAKELNLIAQDTTAYGRDLGGSENIVTLLDKIASISGEKWVRLFYTYPQTFRRGIVGCMKRCRDICRYIDIPIQHIDDGILQKMRRGRSGAAIRNLVEYIKAELPDAALRTSVITGFPGETDRRFKNLLGFIEEGHFDHVGVFSYSEEEGTAAAKMRGHVPEKVKVERKMEILRAQRKISRKHLRRFVGERLKVLIEGASSDAGYVFRGRSEFQAPEIDGVVYLSSGKASIGEFYWVEITSSYDYDLGGRMI